MKLPRDASLDSGMSGFPYGSVCLIEADDGNQRDLTPTALSALASADAVIHDTGICKAIIDLVKPPQYLEAVGPEGAFERSIKLARDRWRVAHFILDYQVDAVPDLKGQECYIQPVLFVNAAVPKILVESLRPVFRVTGSSLIN